MCGVGMCGHVRGYVRPCAAKHVRMGALWVLWQSVHAFRPEGSMWVTMCGVGMCGYVRGYVRLCAAKHVRERALSERLGCACAYFSY